MNLHNGFEKGTPSIVSLIEARVLRLCVKKLLSLSLPVLPDLIKKHVHVWKLRENLRARDFENEATVYEEGFMCR